MLQNVRTDSSVFVVILFTLLCSDRKDCMPTLNLTVYNLILLITLPELAT